MGTKQRFRNEYSRLLHEASDSMMVPFGLCDFYGKLPDPEKEHVNEVLSEWATSEEDFLRYNARFVIVQFKITGLLPSLENAIKKLAKKPGFDAKTEIETLRNIVRVIGTQ